MSNIFEYCQLNGKSRQCLFWQAAHFSGIFLCFCFFFFFSEVYVVFAFAQTKPWQRCVADCYGSKGKSKYFYTITTSSIPAIFGLVQQTALTPLHRLSVNYLYSYLAVL